MNSDSTYGWTLYLRPVPCPICAGGRWPRCRRCESTGLTAEIIRQERMMEWSDYVDAALRTAATDDPKQQLAHAALGIAGELQEVVDAPPGERDREIGDVWWYLALAADAVRELTGGELPGAECRWRRGIPDPQRESGRICEAVESIVFQGEDIDWYEAALRRHIQLIGSAMRAMGRQPAEGAWRMNIDKLHGRHPEGFETRER